MKLLVLVQMHDKGFRDKALPEEKSNLQYCNKKKQAPSVLYHVERHITALPAVADDAYL